MQKIKDLLSDRFIWANYIFSIVLLSITIPGEVFLKALTKLFTFDYIGISLFTFLGFLSIVIVIITVNFILLFPLNYLLNRVSKANNLIYRMYSGLVLLPIVSFLYLKDKFNIGFEICLIPIIISVIIYVGTQYKEIKKIKFWGLGSLFTMTSVIVFFLAYINNVLILALLTVKLFKLKEVLF